MPTKIININSHNEKSLVECNDKGLPDINTYPIKDPNCEITQESKEVWLKNLVNKKENLGTAITCDPMTTGQIVNDEKGPSREAVYRYANTLRGTFEGVMSLFRNIIVIDEQGKIFPVPIISGTPEDAVSVILQENIRKDNSMVIDQPRLPMMAIHSSGISFDPNRYIYHKCQDYMRRIRADKKPGFTVREKWNRDTIFGIAAGIPMNINYNLYVWALYIQDMDQIVTQIISRTHPMAEIKVRGVQWPVALKCDSISNNISVDPGTTPRVVKYLFSLTAESFIPLPVSRQKAVLEITTEVFAGLDLNDLSNKIYENNCKNKS